MRVRVSRVLLIGLSGSGKTTVGPLLAERLGWAFVDVDEAVRVRAGMDIGAIFRREGEPAFRELERRAVAEALTVARVIVAPGAGWAAQAAALDRLPRGTVTVWLRVEPAVAAERIAHDATERPLLTRGAMSTRLAEQHAERAAAYGRAAVMVDTNGRTPEAVAEEIEARLASEYGIDGRAD